MANLTSTGVVQVLPTAVFAKIIANCIMTSLGFPKALGKKVENRGFKIKKTKNNHFLRCQNKNSICFKIF